jgi:transmembrane sensor
MHPDELRVLLHRYFQNQITPEECAILLDELSQSSDEALQPHIDALLLHQDTSMSIHSARKSQLYDQLDAAIKASQQTPSSGSFARLNKKWMGIAASLLLAISLFWGYQNKLLFSQPTISDILLPEQDAPTLTFQNGKNIILDANQEQGNTLPTGVIVAKNPEGGHRIDMSNMRDLGGGLYQLVTPKGHTQQLILPDGSEVWLSTNSSLKFQIPFQANERRVILTGEALFDIKKDKNKPFKVVANGALIEVLGTKFNVSAYSETSRITTTLLEGKVRVINASQTLSLVPGQQAIMETLEGTIQRHQVNTYHATAWKNGFFRFDNESLPSILEKIADWYEIEDIHYKQNVDDVRISGTFRRNKGVGQLLQHLETLTHLQFKIKGRRIDVH